MDDRLLLQPVEADEKTSGGIDILINNAAILRDQTLVAKLGGKIKKHSFADWEATLGTNLTGTFLMAREVAERMIAARRPGLIVNVSSIYGMVSPDQGLYQYRRTKGEAFFKPVAYSASKSALYNVTRYLATYWGDRGVRVNTVTLGGVFDDQDERFVEGYCARVPLGRMAREDDYNGAIVFLLSPASAYMTGSNLIIDGGWTAW